MNKAFPLMAAMGIAVLAASTAHASDGTINFQGHLTDTTCMVNVNKNAGANATVTLPTVSSGILSAPGNTAGQTPFSIDLSGCTGTALGSAIAYFEPGNTVRTDGRLSNTATSGATNVALELIDRASGTMIEAGNTNQFTSTSAVDISSGTASLNYAVQYYAIDETTPGTVTSQVTYSINYL